MEYKIESVHIERFLIIVTYLRNNEIREEFVKIDYDFRNSFYLEGFYPHPKNGSIFYSEEETKDAIIKIVTNTSFKFTNGYIYTIMSADLNGNLEEVRSYKELYWCGHVISLLNHGPYSLDRKLSKDIPGIYITLQEVPENVAEKLQKKNPEKLQENP